MSQARDFSFCFGRLMGEIVFYPYQISLGMTLRYWPGEFIPSVRLHIGPFKLWIGILSRKIPSKQEADHG